jgi:hypothetical protein
MMRTSPVSDRSSTSSLRGEEPGVTPSSRLNAEASPVRELPDVTGFLVVVVVAVGLFIVPVGATLMQGPAIVASLFGAR